MSPFNDANEALSRTSSSISNSHHSTSLSSDSSLWSRSHSARLSQGDADARRVVG